MSINTLLENPPSQSKPWCNLYVDSLTAYKNAYVGGDLEVKGNLKIQLPGDISSQNFYVERVFSYQVHYGSSALGLREFRAIRIGKLVSFWVNQYDILVTSSASYYSLIPLETIPPDFLPIQSFEKPIIVTVGSTKQVGNLTFDENTGEMYIYATPDAGLFTNGEFSSFNDLMISYVVE